MNGAEGLRLDPAKPLPAGSGFELWFQGRGWQDSGQWNAATTS